MKRDARWRHHVSRITLHASRFTDGCPSTMTHSPLATIVFGLASAACWGAGDFCGGLATRRTHVYGVIIASQVVGVIMLIGLALAFREPIPTLAHLAWGGLGGLVGTLGLVAFYRALASGQMGVAAPIGGVVGAATPALLSLFMEGWPGSLKLIGFALALAAVWFVSRTQGAAVRARELGLPLVAGVFFGGFFICIHRASEIGVFWPLVAARLTSLALLTIYTGVTRQPRLPDKAHLPLIALVGVMEVGGNAFYALAARAGRLDVAAVISSLYPAGTVWLAWLILKERITRLQSVGVVAALAAIVLIAV
jgi:drug/metabolite transporter (DMT)-like permease